MLSSLQTTIKSTALLFIRYSSPFDQIWSRLKPFLLQQDVAALTKSLIDESYSKAVLPRIPQLFSKEIHKKMKEIQPNSNYLKLSQNLKEG